jgi:hypothetical protein
MQLDDFNQEYKIFQERDVDKVMSLFDWFRPEDLFFISFVLWFFVPISGLLYLSPLHADILFLFGDNGITHLHLPVPVYLFFVAFIVPLTYIYIINKFRKFHTPGYVGRFLYIALHVKVKGKYNPLKDKDLLNEDYR